MHREIFIIHPSEIIRNGLQVMLKKYFNVEITLLGDLEELGSFSPKENTRILVFAALADHKQLDRLHQLESNHPMLVIQILDPYKQDRPIEGIHYSISVVSTGNDLYSLVSELIKGDQGNHPVKNEGSELTTREVDVLRKVALGFSNKEIAEQLFVSPNTVKTHIKNIYAKLGVNSRVQAVARTKELRL